MILTDANQNTWEKRWFSLKRYVRDMYSIVVLVDKSRRPYLHVYLHSDEKEETAVIGLNGVNIECNPEMEELLGVSVFADPRLRTNNFRLIRGNTLSRSSRRLIRML